MKTNQSPCSHCAGTEFRITTDPKTELATGECRACGMLTLYRLPPIARSSKSAAVALAAAIAILAVAPIGGATPALALEIGDRIAFPGPGEPIACSHLEDTRQGVFHAARYGRQFNAQFANEVNELREKDRLCYILPKRFALEYRVVDKNKTGGGTYFAYFCLIEPNWDSCLWVFLPEMKN